MHSVDWRNIRVVIFDMDGTLYEQGIVRRRMAMRLLIHALTGGWRDALALMHYRRNMEQLANSRAINIHRIQFKATATAFSLPEQKVATVVHKWINVSPLDILKEAVFRDVDRVFANLQSKKIKIGVFSDYPVSEKIAVLALPADAWCSSTDEDIGRLKPETAGLIKIMTRLGGDPSNCLMIGDRMDRDYQCAAAVGVPFLLRTDNEFFTRLAVCLERS